MRLLLMFSVSLCLYLAGYVFAHQEVARECTKLGAFYVGDKVFVCHFKEVSQ